MHATRLAQLALPVLVSPILPIMILIMAIFPSLCYFVPVWSQHSPLHSDFKYQQSTAKCSPAISLVNPDFPSELTPLISPDGFITSSRRESETVHMSLVRILMAVFDISHELEGYLLF
jgi:hypothetical protein